MKKIIVIGMLALSAMVAAEEVIFDKEVTGVNLEQLEVYDAGQKIEIGENEIIKLEDTNLNLLNNQKNNQQVISVSETDENLGDGILKEEKSPIWKFILGAILLVTVGVAI